MILLDANLPYPPSVNTYWRTSTRNGKTRTYLSKEAIKFTDAVKALVYENAPRRNSTARLRCEIVLHQPTKRKQDIDNRLKALLDAMEKAGLYKDDEQFDEITLVRGDVIKGGSVHVRVIEIS